MIQLDYGPNWFYLPTMVIDAVSLLVVLAIALVALKYYKIDKERKKYKYLAVAFILIALAILFKIFNNIPVYYEQFVEQDLGALTQTVESIREYNIFADLSFTLFSILNLIGLYLLYSLYETKTNKRTNFLVIYLIVMLSYFTVSAYYVFHFTSFVFLFFITMVFMNKCKTQINKNTKRLAYGFGTLAVSNLIFMFILRNSLVYVIAELVQLIGYTLLLSALIGILKHGKKENKI